MSNTVLVFENSHNGDTMTYELDNKIFDLTNETQKRNLLTAINIRYNKEFDIVKYEA